MRFLRSLIAQCWNFLRCAFATHLRSAMALNRSSRVTLSSWSRRIDCSTKCFWDHPNNNLFLLKMCFCWCLGKSLINVVGCVWYLLPYLCLLFKYTIADEWLLSLMELPSGSLWPGILSSMKFKQLAFLTEIPQTLISNLHHKAIDSEVGLKQKLWFLQKFLWKMSWS